MEYILSTVRLLLSFHLHHILSGLSLALSLFLFGLFSFSVHTLFLIQRPERHIFAMSLKAELETWANALKAYDEADFESSLDLFSVCPGRYHSPRMQNNRWLIDTHLGHEQRIADSSKILTNMGLIYATLGEHEAAVEQFIAATGLDQYLAVA